MDRSHIGIFAKFWQPGAVKTRLAAAIGNVSASEIYRQSLATLLARFRTVADTRCLVFTPANRRSEFAGLAGDHWQLQPQVDGDLGAKMHAFFTAEFKGSTVGRPCHNVGEAATKIVLIGSDSPTLPQPLIAAAFEQLNTHEVVLGPARDGGYYLIGAAGRAPPVFDGIPWSTREVWPQTIAKLRLAGARFAILPELYDIDTADDLHRLHQELQSPACAEAVFDELRTTVSQWLRN